MSATNTTRATATPNTATPTITEFVTDPQLLGLSISPAQETPLRGIYGLPLAGATWRLCTERDYPEHPTRLCSANRAA